MSAIEAVAESIERAWAKVGHVPVCYVSDDEWRAMCREHFGGPWFGKMTLRGVPIKKLSDLAKGTINASR